MIDYKMRFKITSPIDFDATNVIEEVRRALGQCEIYEQTLRYILEITIDDDIDQQLLYNVLVELVKPCKIEFIDHDGINDAKVDIEAK